MNEQDIINYTARNGGEASYTTVKGEVRDLHMTQARPSLFVTYDKEQDVVAWSVPAKAKGIR